MTTDLISGESFTIITQAGKGGFPGDVDLKVGAIGVAGG